MNIIFVADIFGISNEFKQLCQQIMFGVEHMSGVKCHMQLLGPYQNQAEQFSSEEEAYQYFMKNITLDGYVKTLTQSLSEIPGDKLLVGFSVGGSAIWQLISKSMGKQYLGAVCFYSSQIRHMTQLSPTIPSQLILPAIEQHFSVAALGDVLKEKPSVTIEHSDGLHGFMNELSDNYNHDVCQYYIKRLAQILVSAMNSHR